MFLLSNRNTNENFGEREMLWEHKPRQVFAQRTCVLCLLENTMMQKKEINLFTLIIKM